MLIIFWLLWLVTADIAIANVGGGGGGLQCALNYVISKSVNYRNLYWLPYAYIITVFFCLCVSVKRT